MAKKIEKYVATDGSEHLTDSSADERDALISKLDSIMSKLKPRPDSCSFSNGNLGYIQQNFKTCNEVAESLFDLCREHLSGSFQTWVDAVDKEGAFKFRRSMLCRLIDECCPQPISVRWNRLGCIDDQCREWGQWYYVEHQSDASCQSEYKGG